MSALKTRAVIPEEYNPGNVGSPDMIGHFKKTALIEDPFKLSIKEQQADKQNNETRNENHNVGQLMNETVDTVLPSSQVNQYGFVSAEAAKIKKEREKNAKAMRFAQKIQSDIQEQLAQLGQILQELDEVREDISNIESKHLDDETRQRRPDESEQEHFERLRQELKKKVENGEMSEDEYNRWLELKAKEGELLDRARKIQNELREKLQNEQVELKGLEERITRLRSLDMDLERIAKIEDPKEQSDAMFIVLQQHPEIDQAAMDVNGDGTITIQEAQETVLKEEVQVSEAIETKIEEVREVQQGLKNIEMHMEKHGVLEEPEDQKYDNDLDDLMLDEENLENKTEGQSQTIASNFDKSPTIPNPSNGLG